MFFVTGRKTVLMIINDIDKANLDKKNKVAD